MASNMPGVIVMGGSLGGSAPRFSFATWDAA